MSALRAVVVSDDLMAYKLPKALLSTLKRFDELQSYNAKAGRLPLHAVRLYRADLVSIDDKVRQQSEKKFNAATVRYRGLPLIAHDAPSVPFGPEGA